MKRKNSGYTLVEMLVVISMIMVLMALTMVVVREVMHYARVVKLKTFLSQINTASANYKLAEGQSPWGQYDENGEPWDLTKEMNPCDVFAELNPWKRNSLNVSPSWKLKQKQDRKDYIEGMEDWIRNGEVVDIYGNPFMMVYEKRHGLVVWSAGPNGKNETIDLDNGTISKDKGDDISLFE